MGSLYLFCLLVGGFFVGAAALSGADHDAPDDFDADFDGFHLDADSPEGMIEALDLDMDTDLGALPEADLAAEHALEVVGSHEIGDHGAGEHGMPSDALWLPLFSFRFWTFGSCFFGLTGTLLTWLNLAPPGTIFAVSGGMGLACGTTASWVMRKLRRLEHSRRTPVLSDYAGAIGTVLLPVGQDKTGKVRCSLRGHSIDLLAQTDEKGVLPVGTKVLLLGFEDEHAQVVHAGRLLSEDIDDR